MVLDIILIAHVFVPRGIAVRSFGKCSEEAGAGREHLSAATPSATSRAAARWLQISTAPNQCLSGTQLPSAAAAAAPASGLPRISQGQQPATAPCAQQLPHPTAGVPSHPCLHFLTMSTMLWTCCVCLRCAFRWAHCPAMACAVARQLWMNRQLCPASSSTDYTRTVGPAKSTTAKLLQDMGA